MYNTKAKVVDEDNCLSIIINNYTELVISKRSKIAQELKLKGGEKVKISISKIR